MRSLQAPPLSHGPSYWSKSNKQIKERAIPRCLPNPAYFSLIILNILLRIVLCVNSLEGVTIFSRGMKKVYNLFKAW